MPLRDNLGRSLSTIEEAAENVLRIQQDNASSAQPESMQYNLHAPAFNISAVPNPFEGIGDFSLHIPETPTLNPSIGQPQISITPASPPVLTPGPEPVGVYMVFPSTPPEPSAAVEEPFEYEDDGSPPVTPEELAMVRTLS